MKCGKINLLRPIFGFLCLALSAEASSLSLQSTPELKVLVYGFASLSPWLLQGAESEAARVLRALPMKLNWIDCTSETAPECMRPQPGADLIVRFVPRGFPSASVNALGMAESTDGYATAFIFLDRVLALRTYTRPLHIMLGRVLAHEIVHLLLPREGHSNSGLMCGVWPVDDVASSMNAGLPERWIRLMRREALRRAVAARKSTVASLGH